MALSTSHNLMTGLGWSFCCLCHVLNYTKYMTLQSNLSGIWQSRYKYNSSSQPGEQEGKHKVRIFQSRDKLVIESTADNNSYLVMRLAVDEHNNIATGTWQEVTATKGHYKGAVYHGAIQLLI